MRTEEAPFTSHIVALGSARDRADDEVVDALRKALRRSLITELKRRGLWHAPPSYLGVLAAESWWAEGSAPGGTPLDELVADCYSFIFVDRLRALRAQLSARDNIDGLVLMNVRHFLYERQKEHDRLGFRIYETLSAAVREALEAGEMVVLGGDPKIRNDTILGLDPTVETAEASESADLPAAARRWNDVLLPDLVTAQGRGRRKVIDLLRRRFGELRSEGIASIRFGDLLDLLKSDARARWAALLDREAIGVAPVGGGDSDDLLPALARKVRPDLHLEARDAFRALVGCIAELVAGVGEGDRAGYLTTLWEFLRTWAGAGGGEEEPPSQRKLAALLGIPRDRLPELYAHLRRFAEQCEEGGES